VLDESMLLMLTLSEFLLFLLFKLNNVEQ
jgi:hypothetical protein